jgi:hypothetical protein
MTPILDSILAAYTAGLPAITLSGTQYDALVLEMANSTTLSDYDRSEIAAYRFRGSLAIGVDYSIGA